MKALAEDLICEHSLLYARGSMGFTELSDGERAMFKPVRQRLVRTHPVTGRKSLFLSSHIGTIVGWQIPEARDLIRELIEHATQRAPGRALRLLASCRVIFQSGAALGMG